MSAYKSVECFLNVRHLFALLLLHIGGISGGAVTLLQPEAELSRGDVGPGVVDADGVGGGGDGRRWAVDGGPCCSLGTWLGPPWLGHTPALRRGRLQLAGGESPGRSC